MSDRPDFLSEAEEDRVEISKQSEAKGGILLDDTFHLG